MSLRLIQESSSVSPKFQNVKSNVDKEFNSTFMKAAQMANDWETKIKRRCQQ